MSPSSTQKTIMELKTSSALHTSYVTSIFKKSAQIFQLKLWADTLAKYIFIKFEQIVEESGEAALCFCNTLINLWIVSAQLRNSIIVTHKFSNKSTKSTKVVNVL